jgi:hypothetical protein
MHQKVIDVTPYQHTYYACNKHTGEVSGDFDCLQKIVQAISAKPRRHPKQDAFSFTRKLEADKKHLSYNHVYDYTVKDWWSTRTRVVAENYYYPAPDWVIVNDLGEIVDREAVNAATRATYRRTNWELREERCNMLHSRLLRRKGSGAKIKTNCTVVPSHGRYGGYESLVYGYYRVPQTRNEMAQNAGHEDEYGEWMVRGRRRGKNLPNSYSDRPRAIREAENSWKHHSRRKKQWVPK